MSEGKPTTKNPGDLPSSGLKLGDVYYVLFRRKWLILSFLMAGVIAAGIVYFTQGKPLYVSEAKLLLRYVVENKAMEAGTGAQVHSPGYAGDTIISSELEILRSMDLCEEVALLVGPEKLLAILGGGSNLTAAATVVYGGLTADNPPRSNIIRVRFLHPDPSLCQLVLEKIIESYFTRHKLVHRAPVGHDDILSQEAQTLLIRIRSNEEKLRESKTRAGVISVADAKKDLSNQRARLREELFIVEEQLAEYRSLSRGQESTPAKIEKTETITNAPPETVAEYRLVRRLLESLRIKEFEMLFQHQYTEEHPQLKLAREQLAYNEKRKQKLETEFPKLADLYAAQPLPGPPSGIEISPAARVAGLESRIKKITNHLEQVRNGIAELDNLESSITDVQRTLELDQRNYMHMAASLEAARFSEALSAVKLSNIQPVQKPTIPTLNVSKRLKAIVIPFFGLAAAGIGLAFLMEFVVDHTVRRPGDFETRFRMPLFLSIPKMDVNGHARMLPFPSRALPEGSNAAQAGNNTWSVDHPLRDYIDGLRDRTLTFFEGDPHKPKLIALTSCRQHAGVTSLAAGLAGALSETGDGNVLLLNLNCDAEGAHPFYRGELTCDLADAIESDKRQGGMVLHNLYVATAGSAADPAANNLPKQLARIVPQLRVSDYDYIVFDLPPTTPTTMTARLAAMMDLVILVVESEKDSQEAVKQAGKLLSRSKAPVSAVLNKVRNPVPLWLHQGA